MHPHMHIHMQSTSPTLFICSVLHILPFPSLVSDSQPHYLRSTLLSSLATLCASNYTFHPTGLALIHLVTTAG